MGSNPNHSHCNRQEEEDKAKIQKELSILTDRLQKVIGSASFLGCGGWCRVSQLVLPYGVFSSDRTSQNQSHMEVPVFFFTVFHRQKDDICYQLPQSPNEWNQDVSPAVSPTTADLWPTPWDRPPGRWMKAWSARRRRATSMTRRSRRLRLERTMTNRLQGILNRLDRELMR